jgi:uncharacterized protein
VVRALKLKPSRALTDRPEVTPDLLSDIARRIVESFRPEKIVLFGSYAGGRPGPDSDIDLLIIMETGDDPAERVRKIRRVAKVTYLPMDVIVRTPAEIRERISLGDSFIVDILAQGKTLYDRAAD